MAGAVAGPQPGALAQVPAEAPVAMEPRGLGDLCPALRRFRRLRDRRDDRRQPLGPRAWRRGQQPSGGGRAAAAQRLGRDEPARAAAGSLDVLMATPLPTRAIVWGKWCLHGLPPPKSIDFANGHASVRAIRIGYRA